MKANRGVSALLDSMALVWSGAQAPRRQYTAGEKSKGGRERRKEGKKAKEREAMGERRERRKERREKFTLLSWHIPQTTRCASLTVIHAGYCSPVGVKGMLLVS